MRPVLAMATLAATAACSFERRGLGDGGGGADADPFAPDASLVDAAAIDADPLRPDAEPCIQECLDDTHLRDCDSGGEVVCPLGCLTTGSPHCARQIVSNDPMAEMHLMGVPAAADLTVTAGIDDPIGMTYAHWEIFTDTGEIYDANTDTTFREPGTGIDPATGIAYYDDLAGIGVFVFDSLTIADGARLWVYGSRALLVLSRGDVVVNGIIDVTAGVSADGTMASLHYPGPGGFEGGVGGVAAGGCARGLNGYSGGGDETGGGGGALAVGRDGAPGGNGGSPSLGGAGGVPMSAACPSASVVPLQGGSGGGSGGTGGNGGGGGGAVQLVSFTAITFEQITFTSEVGVWAGGQGGGGGGGTNGGGGGGSGGAILLEAPTVDLGGFTFLAANGGGGGAGATSGLTANGSLGGTGSTAAPGGLGTRSGGIGGAGTGDPTAGIGGGDGTGGGGGAVGIIAINSAGGTSLGTISPPATAGVIPTE